MGCHPALEGVLGNVLGAKVAIRCYRKVIFFSGQGIKSTLGCIFIWPISCYLLILKSGCRLFTIRNGPLQRLSGFMCGFKSTRVELAFCVIVRAETQVGYLFLILSDGGIQTLGTQ